MKKCLACLAALVAVLVMGQVAAPSRDQEFPCNKCTWLYESRTLATDATETFIVGPGAIHGVWSRYYCTIWDGDHEISESLPVGGGGYGTTFHQLDVPFSAGISITGTGLVTVLYRR